MPGPINMPSKPWPQDTWEVTVLEDGRIKITTGPTSAAIHTTAEQFLGEINRLAGGPVVRERRPGARPNHSHHGNHHHH